MDKTIYSRFKEIAVRYPSEAAIIEEENTYTFSELDRLTDMILSKFYDEAPESVGIVMSHGAMQIAAMLAVLKSGARYIPAEPALPRERIEYMMQSAGAKLIITDEFCKNLKQNSRKLADRSRPDGAAYILFTSGTSGKPKGVIVENHSVVNYAEAFEQEFKVGPGDIMLQYSVCSFDIFVEEVFASLLNGVAVAVPPKEIYCAKTEALMEFVKRKGVTIIDGFPYLIAEMNKLPEIPVSIKLIISGGDVIRASYITNLRDKDVKIYNTYGPSETTVCSNYYRVDNAEPLSDGTFPIGKPVKGVNVKILNSRMEEVSDGEPGEICIFGEGVSRGYLGNPPEQKNFITFEDGTRMYRSGDLGYILPDGNMAFIHRCDDQVMILGRRVEPEEVENVLSSAPGVERGVVRAFHDDCGLPYLTAYIVPNTQFNIKAVKEYLESRLVDFMVPEYFILMKNIPLTPRGKVNTKALPVVLKEGKYNP